MRHTIARAAERPWAAVAAAMALGFRQGIDQETAKKISKEVRDQGFKKVQVQIQGEELRVTAPRISWLAGMSTSAATRE